MTALPLSPEGFELPCAYRLDPMTMKLFVPLRVTYYLPHTETRDPMTLLCSVRHDFPFSGAIINCRFPAGTATAARAEPKWFSDR